MRRAWLAVCCLLWAAFRLAAQVTYAPRDEEVVRLQDLYLLARQAFPTAGYPLSQQTLADLAARLERLAPDRAPELERYLRCLGYAPGAIQLGLRNRVALEGYARAGFTDPTDWEHEFLDRKPLWRLDMSMARSDRAAILIEAVLKRQYLDDLPVWNLPGSQEGNPVALENDQVARGLFWYDFGPLQLELGRDRVHFGTLRSSLLPSSRLPFLDMLRLTLPLGNLTMDLLVSSLQNRRAVDDVDLSANPNFEFGKNVILANLHRFEYDFGRVRAAVTGLSIFVREKNGFALADFFPVFSWHASQYRPFNLSLVFDLEAVLAPGLRLMAELGFDDINTSGIGVGDAAIPTIPAVIAGLEFLRPLRRAELRLYAEAGYTHYLWGNFDDESHAVLARAIYRLYLDDGTRTMPLTSPYGPGAIWAFAEAALCGRDGLSGSLCAELVFTNPHVDLLHTVYQTDSAAGALANKTGTLRLGVKVRYHPWKWLEVYTRPQVTLQPEGPGMEVVLGACADSDWRKPLR
jgi:hypothetical protein